MKKGLVFLLLLLAISTVHAQVSWKVLVNKKVLINAKEENVNENTGTLTRGILKKAGALQIIYNDPDSAMWLRTFHFYDEKDNPLYTKTGLTNYTVPFSTLRKYLKGIKKLNIYTTVAPTDPTMAVRVRRMHIATFILQ